MVDYKRWIKRGLVSGGLLSLTQRLLGPRTVIVRYHSVKVSPGDYEHSIGKGIVHSETAFTQQMEWLARTYEPVTLDDVASAIVDRRPMPNRGVLITFDDGYADNFDVALPVLNRLGIKAAFYITVDCVEHQKMPWFCRLRHAFALTVRERWEDPSEHRPWDLRDPLERRRAFLNASEACARQSGVAQDDLIGGIERGLGVSTLAPAERLMMNWEQIRELHSQRHTVGSHTLTHPNLAQVGGNDLVREMRESRKKLEEKLGSPVRHFSYPNPILQPHWSEGTMACCKESGYQTAVTCTPGPVLAADSLLCLKRIPAPEKMEDFQWTVQCAFLGRYAGERAKKSPSPPAPSPKEGEGEKATRQKVLLHGIFWLPLSPRWERGLGGEGIRSHALSVGSVSHFRRSSAMTATQSEKEVVWTRARGFAKHVAQCAVASLVKRIPVNRCPGWAGEALGVKVPGGVRPHARKSPEGSANINLLLRFLQETRHLPGEVAECGVFRGATLLTTGLYLEQNRVNKILFGFDSFAGFDDTINIDLQLGGRAYRDKRVGGLSQTSHAAVWDKATRLGLAARIRLIKGYFESSLRSVEDCRFSFVHLDCDIYQSYKTCLEFFYPRLVPGAVVLLDEYNDPPWPGCNKAVDEFLADKPETLCECESDNYQKWYFRKR